MEACCPDCHHVMVWQSESVYLCTLCQIRYKREERCPECNHLLQELKACGAVDYFCQQHGMISKRRVVLRYAPAN
ncbi:zinc ribbon domain-containing protein [Samsonia erythrinae]|uniref:Zinc ribbon protein n=1 Tax=Samsonia erythrinae TaxID=160434 RepID=A0A4R3VM34_9GAMM|nr:zinc ribbon domain-containing protein [Samsonia erythrinae]TCV04195.1 zinc ribbon protein [Samsonia erythrinae]